MNKKILWDGRCRPSNTRGFTLVELMVAMLIGIFLSMALTGIYVSLKRSFFSEDSIVNTQENQRLALSMLTNSIQSAGYFPDPLGSDSVTAFAADTPDTPFTTAGQVIHGTSGDQESISVRYLTQPNDGILNCTGAENDTGANAIFTNTFSVNPSHELVCESSTNGGDGNSVVLARNISKLEFQYATDSDSDGVVDAYLDADGVDGAAEAGWNRVHAVRIEITLMDTINKAESENKAMPKAVTHYVNLMNSYEVPN